MADKPAKVPSPDKTRRRFIKGIGAGAVGISMIGGAGRPKTQKSVIDWDAPELGPEPAGVFKCPALMHVTDRVATAVTPNETLDCADCSCTVPQDHEGAISVHRFGTTFKSGESGCDELIRIPISDDAVMEWSLFPRYTRVNGPCNVPVGAFDGRWRLIDSGGGGGPIALLAGRIHGTWGFSFEDDASACCRETLTYGTLIGRGRPGTRTESCIVHWSFHGVGGEQGPTVCDLLGWDVSIRGIVRCPCGPIE